MASLPVDGEGLRVGSGWLWLLPQKTDGRTHDRGVFGGVEITHSPTPSTPPPKICDFWGRQVGACENGGKERGGGGR
ncbi:MAG: hypothetical protein JW908_17040 [Anaerolineales bacterium]|nr:hypothetical protein [Anaerolineales bacterium]